MTFERPHLPVDDRIGTRTRRRRQVATLYAGYVVACSILAATSHAPSIAVRITGLVVVVAIFFVAANAFWKLMGRTFVNAPNISDADLDERQRARAYSSLRTAYPVLGILTALVPLYAAVATTAEHWAVLRDPTLVADCAWALFLVAITLPTAILAWTEPDPLVE
ncbi:MAG: hypothetical protein NVS3B7_04470 [Candidatus Elarobacter sp.]